MDNVDHSLHFDQLARDVSLLNECGVTVANLIYYYVCLVIERDVLVSPNVVNEPCVDVG